ncbi:isopenicillin-N N-acyltransferase-like protein [Catenulispora sp. EB89]|uniref:C45 family autoproteolytic acyltransferase/hydolase n=1 Tax=Catenulispora sp. EB89 TaxID=3156257 RepID=UPI003513FBE6
MTDTSVLSVPYIRAHGDPFSVGHQHGAALSEALHAFLDDGLTRLNRILPEPVTPASLGSQLAAYSVEISAATPDLAEELRGLAQGADISYEQALLLQLRREIMGYSKIPTMGDCTTYARLGDSRPGTAVLAQTVDLNGDLDDQISVLDVSRPGSGRRSLVLSFGGLLGYLGINSDGLAVGLNLVLGGQWRPGLPPYLAIRHLLDTATGVDDAVAILRGLRLASSRSLMLCDGSKAVCVEILGDEIRVVDSQELVHTNHFLHPDFVLHDELNVFARNSSLLRLKACQAALPALPADASPEEHFALMSAAPICVADNGDVRRERTVAAVVMRPEHGELHLRPGDPSRSVTQSFSLAAP